jgi:hypothetical protein
MDWDINWLLHMCIRFLEDSAFPLALRSGSLSKIVSGSEAGN